MALQRYKLSVAVVALLVLVIGCQPGGPAADDDADAAAVEDVEGDSVDVDAIEDDEVVVYGVHQEHVMERVLDAFREATGVEYSMIRLSSGEATTRVLQEMDDPAADVVLAGPSENHEVLAQEGAVTAYDSPVAEERDGGEWSSPDGYWHGYYLGPLSIGVNADRWEEEFGGDIDISSWDDLLREEFEGELVMASPFTSGTSYNFLATQMFRYDDDEAAWDYLHGFDQQVAHYPTSGAAPAQMVGTGEYLLGITFVHDMLAVADAGFPVEPIIPDETGFEVGAVSIIEGGPNPSAAQALVDFVLSAEAGQVQTDLSKNLSLHPDVDNPPEAPDMDDLDIVDFDVDHAAQMRDEWLDEWEARIGEDPAED